MLDGDPAPPVRPMSIMTKRSPISATAELLLNSISSVFSGPGRTIGPVCVCVCVCVLGIIFELSDL